MSFTLCTSGAIVMKAGKNVYSSAATSAALLQQFSNDAEGQICTTGRYDFVSNYAQINATGKLFLAQVASDLAGLYLMEYDLSGYTNSNESSNMMALLRDRAMASLRLIEDKKYGEDFLK